MSDSEFRGLMQEMPEFAGRSAHPATRTIPGGHFIFVASRSDLTA